MIFQKINHQSYQLVKCMFAFLVIEVPKEKKMEGKGWCDGKNGIK
jgi:hypothetical protein